MSVEGSRGESLKDRWTKYIIASVLIHAAVLSVPLSFTVPRMAGPIEVFMLEGPGSSAPSGEIEKQDKSLSKPRLERRRPMAREEVRIRPQEPLKPVEQKVKPVQQATEKIAVAEPAARNDSAAGIQLKSGMTIGGVREEKASFSSGGAAGTASGSGRGAGDADVGFGSPSGPRFLHREIPEYPFLARKRRIEGKVILVVVIDAAGRLTKAEVVEATDRTFAEASLEALKKSTFLPARRNGRPVTSKALLPIRFSLTE